ncbi:MAG TPA: chemotaxis protein CheB [Blastocatellia bacterium]|nr:chemotaxis protein CheB [Blastocatellia bacterium]
MRYELVVVGASLGGFHALENLLGGLPASFPMPVVIVQHRSGDSDEMLVNLLMRKSRLPVVEAEDKQAIIPGKVYIAPANYHLLVEEGHLALSTQSAVEFARPSIDVMFESAADAFRERVIAVLLTGSNKDGAQGMARIKECGGLAVVQDPASSENGRMPAAAIAAAAVDRILPLPDIANFLIDIAIGRKVKS